MLTSISRVILHALTNPEPSLRGAHSIFVDHDNVEPSDDVNYRVDGCANSLRQIGNVADHGLFGVIIFVTRVWSILPFLSGVYDAQVQCMELGHHVFHEFPSLSIVPLLHQARDTIERT